MKKYIVFFLLSLLIFSFHILYSKHAIYGDGNGYFAYAHALYFQKSLDFDPIYNYLSNFQGRDYKFSRIFWNTTIGSNGIRHNMWTIGTSLFWIPSLFLIDIFSNLFGLHLSKFDIIYEIGPGITGIFLMLSGLYFLEKFLKNYFQEKVIAWVITSLIFATNFGYFLFFEPALSHQPAFFLVSLLLYTTIKIEYSYLNFFLLGLLSGLLFITRMVDSVLLIPIIIIYFQKIRKLQKFKLFILVTLSGLIIAVIPQVIIQNIIFGKFWINAYISGEQGRFILDPRQIFQAFFSARRGLFIWSPILLLAFFGLVVNGKRKINLINKIFFVPIVLYFLLLSTWNSILAAGYGNRFFLSSIPFLSFGLANIFTKFSKKTIIIVVLSCIIWNTLLLGQFFSDKERIVDGRGLTLSNFILGQITFPLKLIEKIR